VRLADFHGLYPAIFFQARRRRGQLAPVIWRAGLHGYFGRRNDQIGLAECPLVIVVPNLGGRQVGGVAFGGAVIDPLGDRRDLVIGERHIVLIVLDPDVLLDEPGRHGSALVAERGALLDRPGPRPRVLIGDQRHGRDAVLVVALLAASLEYRCNILG